jgi:hypothetical protein
VRDIVSSSQSRSKNLAQKTITALDRSSALDANCTATIEAQPIAAVSGPTHQISRLGGTLDSRTGALAEISAAGAQCAYCARRPIAIGLYQQTQKLPDTESQKNRGDHSVVVIPLEQTAPQRTCRGPRTTATTNAGGQRSRAGQSLDTRWKTHSPPKEFGKATKVSSRSVSKIPKILGSPATVPLRRAIATFGPCFIPLRNSSLEHPTTVISVVFFQHQGAGRPRTRIT